jgi:hypothetical protein
MAAMVEVNGDCSEIHVEISNQRLKSNCSNCQKLNSELKKAKDEILSYKEVIKMLRAELSEKVLCNEFGDPEQSNCIGEKIKAPCIEEDWVLVAAKKKKIENLKT